LANDLFAGKRVFVTGAATGIGRATAEYLAGEGARVFGAGLDGEEGRRVFSAAGPGLVFRETDLTREAEVRAAVDEAVTALGGLDGVVNCAGIYPTGKRLEDVSDAEWDKTLAVNLTAIFRVCRATLAHLRTAGGGAIVNIASVHADHTFRGYFPYAAAKSGLVGMTRSLALEVGPHQVRVNALSPGWTETALVAVYFSRQPPETRQEVLAVHPMGRIGTPAEIATCAAFLLSDEASFVTGANWRVDGGLGARFAG
jgi:NAD(P)-dependent dehydrogenase (short-subunit alcohol dehydrogenase family)